MTTMLQLEGGLALIFDLKGRQGEEDARRQRQRQRRQESAVGSIYWRMIRILAVALAFLLNYEIRATPEVREGDAAVVARMTPGNLRRGMLDAAASKSKPATQPLTKETVDLVWDDLDLSSTVSCGAHRCFVPSLSDATAGYIVAKAEDGTLASMVDATQMAREIATNYRAGHLFLPNESPLEATMPDATRRTLNERVRNPLREHQFPTSVGTNGTIHEFYDSPIVCLQRMRRADPGSILAHCADNGFTRTQLLDFVAAVNASNPGDDLGAFAANLARGRYAMHLTVAALPQLRADLQALVGTDGEVALIDFGGHAGAWTGQVAFELTIRREEELCGETFDMILDALERREEVARGEWTWWNSREYHRLHSYGNFVPPASHKHK